MISPGAVFMVAMSTMHADVTGTRVALKTLLNSTLFARARARLHGEILRALTGCRTIVDLAAGDDRFYLRLAAEPWVDRILLNDIDLDALRRAAVPNPKVLRICSDATALSALRCRFDGVLVKNVLHHMADRGSIMRLLGTARAIAHRVVVVEIEDPRHTGLVPRLLQRVYYRRILDERDNEDLFFRHEALRELLSDAYPDRDTSFRRIETVRGTYTLFRADVPIKESHWT